MTPVLYYHRVGPFRAGAPRKMTVTPENFAAQMRFLRRRRTNILTLDEVLAGKRGVAITFDDGFRDIMEHALPVLRELRFTATFFIVAGLVGKTDAWMRGTDFPEERLADWDDLRRLVDAGMTIGAHSMTHGLLTPDEVAEPKRILEDRLGVRVDHFAYPRGEQTPETVGWVRDAGYRGGWATKSGTADPFLRRRLPVSASAGLVSFAARLLKARLGYY